MTVTIVMGPQLDTMWVSYINGKGSSSWVIISCLPGFLSENEDRKATKLPNVLLWRTGVVVHRVTLLGSACKFHEIASLSPSYSMFPVQLSADAPGKQKMMFQSRDLDAVVAVDFNLTQSHCYWHLWNETAEKNCHLPFCHTPLTPSVLFLCHAVVQ